MRRGAPPARGGGFTLIELLVVIAIIVVAGALVGPSVGRMTQKPPTPAAAARFVDALAHLRDDAARRGKAFRGFLDFDARNLADAGGAPLFPWPEDLEVAPADPRVFDAADMPVEAPPALRQRRRLPCVFRADGGGCPLELRLSDAGYLWLVSVDAVTGRIRMRRVESFGADV